MRVFLATLALSLVIPASAPSQDKHDTAYKLMVLSQVPYARMDQTEKRYRYVLPKLAWLCSDISSDERAADMLLVARNLITDAGLNEDLPGMVERLYQVTQAVSVYSQPAQMPFKCREIWSFYVLLRREGHEPAAAQRTTENRIIDLLRSATK